MWTAHDIHFPRDHSRWSLVWWLGLPGAVAVRQEVGTSKLYVVRGYSDTDYTILAGPCDTQEEINAHLTFLRLHGMLDEELST